MLRIFGLALLFSLQAYAFINGAQSSARITSRAPALRMLFGSFSSASSANKNKLCVITGTTSGLGKETVRALLKKGNYQVVCAVRDTKKMEAVIEKEFKDFDASKLKVLELDLASFDSTKKFVSKLKDFKKSKALDVLVCNAAVYQPALPTVGSLLSLRLFSLTTLQYIY